MKPSTEPTRSDVGDAPPSLMQTFLIRRRTGWTTPEQLEKAASRASRVALEEMPDRVRWIRSYVTREENGSLGTVCVFQAADAESVRKHAARADMPADEIMSVGETVVIEDDPPPAPQTPVTR